MLGLNLGEKVPGLKRKPVRQEPHAGAGSTLILRPAAVAEPVILKAAAERTSPTAVEASASFHDHPDVDDEPERPTRNIGDMPKLPETHKYR